jgi:hypothetical protein
MQQGIWKYEWPMKKKEKWLCPTVGFQEAMTDIEKVVEAC